MSLHPLNALDATPFQLIEIAGSLAVEYVCLFTHVPLAAKGRYPCVAREDVAAVCQALSDHDVKVCNIEVFPLDRDGLRDDLRAGLEIGRKIGSGRATAHLHDIASHQQAVDRFGQFAALASSYGIIAGLEFNNFSAVRDISSASGIVRASGIGSLVLDTLHLVRGGYSAADVGASADLIGYVQLSDGPAEMPIEGRWHEAVSERLVPGEGIFPLIDILRLIRPNSIFELEVPQVAAMKSGVTAAERAGRAIAAGRKLLAAL